MTDHAHELRRYARKIAHPAGDVPSVMLAAADEIERLAARLEAAEEDRARFLVEMGRLCAQCDALRLRIKAAEKERDALHAKIEAMEKQEPVAWCATDETGTVIEALGMNQSRRFDTALYLAPGAKGE